MRIAICEDNENHANSLEKMILQWSKAENQKVDIQKYDSAEHFLGVMDEVMNDSMAYQLIFIDIQMKKLDGMELARIIRKEYQEPILVFTTGVKELAPKGYEVSAFRYLVKPLKEKEVSEILSTSCAALNERVSDAILIHKEGEIRRLQRGSILYVESEDHYLCFHLENGTVRVKGKLSEYASQLPEPRFSQCHRSYIVNLHYVVSLAKSGITMEDGTILPISRNRWEAVNKAYMKCYLG